MLEWRQQGPAYTAPVKLDDGRAGSVVVLGGSDNPKGLALVVQGDDGQQSIEFPAAAAHLPPATLLQVYCAQERAFGASGLPKLLDS